MSASFLPWSGSLDVLILDQSYLAEGGDYNLGQVEKLALSICDNHKGKASIIGCLPCTLLREN